MITAVALVALPFESSARADQDDDKALPQHVDRKYDQLIQTEKERINRRSLFERMASGLAALTIGLYGYYNDNRGELTQVLYSATQTTGVIMISGAILDANQPSLLLLTDRYLNSHEGINLEKYKRGIVLIEERRELAEAKRLAYTSLILSSLYAYDGYRSTGTTEALKNVFYFLSFNFALIAGANFYRISTHETAVAAVPRGGHFEFAVLPVPSVRYLF